MSGRVRDVASSAFVALASDAPVAQAREAVAAGGYVVIVDSDGQPVGVLGAGQLSGRPGEQTLGKLLRDGPPLILVSAELDVTAAAEAPALREVETVVVVVAGDEVVGIWDGESLAGAVLSGGASRSAKDWGLMGVVDQIPKVRRPCGHNEGAASCLVVVEFPEKPDEMPQCPNPHGLSPHRFVW